MREVAAHAEVETEDFIAGFQAGEKYGCIGLGAAMGLYIGPGSIEYFFQPVDGQVFNFIHYFTTSVIAPAGITFGVLIGGYSAHGLHHLQGGKVFRSYQFYSVSLAFQFFIYQIKYLRIFLHGAKIGEL